MPAASANCWVKLKFFQNRARKNPPNPQDQKHPEQPGTAFPNRFSRANLYFNQRPYNQTSVGFSPANGLNTGSGPMTFKPDSCKLALATGPNSRNQQETPMSQLAQLEKKIEQLETRIAFQDQTIEELNQTITSQWSEFDRLRREISRLGEQLADLSPPDQSTGEPPPHY